MHCLRRALPGSCPVDAIEMNAKEEPIINADKCIGCQKCVKICPGSAIEMFFTPEELKILEELAAQGGAAAAADEDEKKEAKAPESNIAAWKGVWVFVEQFEGHAHEVSWELLGKGRMLANDLGVELAAFVLGDNVKHLARRPSAGARTKSISWTARA